MSRAAWSGPAGASAAIVGAWAAILLGVGCTNAPRIEPGDPLPGLTPAERAQFDRGRVEFMRAFTPETGLGPTFNADRCAECHENPAAGGSGDEIETHVSGTAGEGACDPLVELGGFVIQQHVTPALKAAMNIDAEPVPPGALMAHRTAPPIFGRGLLDAVPDSVILALADPDDRNRDGISGRPNRGVDGRIGRFGRKAFVPTLTEFNEGAFVIEQGITSPAIPTEENVGGAAIPEGADPTPEPEIGADSLEAVDAIVRFLAPPAPLPLKSSGKRGRYLFTAIGCAGCHTPALRTGDSPSAALRDREVAAYTDLLLHDMGPGLADICLGLAAPSEFRTEPLMGLRFAEGGDTAPRFLHDGRAKSIEEAIVLHDGEAAHSRQDFQGLSAKDRAALLQFLRSL